MVGQIRQMDTTTKHPPVTSCHSECSFGFGQTEEIASTFFFPLSSTTTNRVIQSVQSLYFYMRCKGYSLCLETFFLTDKALHHYLLMSDIVSAEFIFVYAMQRLFTTFSVTNEKVFLFVQSFIDYSLLGISLKILSIISLVKMTLKSCPPSFVEITQQS